MQARSEQGWESRRAHRSSLFLAAEIEAGSGRAPVRIRNLSETGAMIEGPAFPPVGTSVRLKRQQVEMDAQVVWVRSNQCGLSFVGRVAVAEWVAGRSGPIEGQARVDAIQAAVRSGGSVSDINMAAQRMPAATGQNSDQLIAEEIAYVQRLLDNVSSQLINDPAIVNRHPQALQSFDIADQILGHLARVLQAAERDTAIKSIGMEELRARLMRKPLA